MTAGSARALSKSASELSIQEWVHQRHGFVPHPFWITHCKELYLGAAGSPEGRLPRHECPKDKRAAIKEAFSHLGLLPQ